MSIRSTPARTRGALLGGVLGDAGAAVQSEAQPGLFPASPGISSDGALMLATCDALVRDGGYVDPARIAAVFSEWYLTRRLPDGGAASLQPIRDLAAGAHWTAAGSAGGRAVAAGATLRAAPLAFFVDPSSEAGVSTLRATMRITDHDDEALAAALALVLAIRWCLDSGTVPPALPDEIAGRIPDSAVRAALKGRSGGTGGPGTAMPDIAEVTAAGFAAAVRWAGDMDRGLRAAASVDPAAAATAGLILGAAGAVVPVSLVASLPRRSDIESILEPFVQLVDTVTG